MPLERKILITILALLSTALGGYIFYIFYYLNYKDNLNKIDKYEGLIGNIVVPNSTLTQDDFDALALRIDRINDLFFTTSEASPERLSPFIKAMLEGCNISITRYRTTTTGVSFSINGEIEDFSRFLYKLSSANRAYDIPLLNIRMVDNTKFTGTIEVVALVLKSKPVTERTKETLMEPFEKLKFKPGVMENWGTSLFEEVPIVIEDVKEPVIKRENTDKFSFVGVLKKSDSLITMFRENNNGRIYRFTDGESVSGWLYRGQEEDSFIFENDGVIYEVTH